LGPRFYRVKILFSGSKTAIKCGLAYAIKNTVRLAPGETKSVNLSMTIPKNPAPQQLSNTMLFYTSERTKSRTRNGLNMNVLIEVGIQVYHTPSD
jgi:hypothetical protein